MLRPPRNKGRFQGETTTTLSNPYASADGRRMRRRYAIYGAAGIAALVVIIMLTKGGGGSSAPARQPSPKAPKGAYVLDSQENMADAQVKTYTHAQSGMQVLTMVPDDLSQDAVFGLSFRTKPEDDTGAAYIVEKAIQSGSKNFPIKDPFNQLERGSLQTFMETKTEKDRTTFVYASRNQVDFRNAIKVYLDGVFKPNFMSEDYNWIFRQEAWRFYLGGKDGKDLKLSGNAINEAKAIQMNPAAAHGDYVFQKIFEGHPYGWKQKGDFRRIVTLNRAKLREFYTRHYHPSNGQAFCFGPQEFIDECLNEMNPYLSEYQADPKIRQYSDAGWHELDKIQSIKETVAYPSFQNSNDFRLAVSYVLNDQPIDDRTKMAWILIEELLVGSSAAVIPRLIAEQNLGDDAIGGVESDLRQWLLTVGVSGIPSDEKVEEARIKVEQRLIQVASNGFDDDAVKGALNTIEMRFRDHRQDSQPRGVQLFKSLLTVWNYDQEPSKALLLSNALPDLKAEIEENGQAFLIQVMTRHLIDNRHRLVTHMFPSTQLANTYAQQEQEWLDNTDSWLSKEDGLNLLRETEMLHEIQQTPDPQKELDKISPLKVSDLRTTNFEYPNKLHDDIFDSGITMLEHELPNSNGVAYVDFAIDMSNLDFSDIVFLPLFCQLLVQSGSSFKNGVKLQREIREYTGGMEVVPVVEEVVESAGDGGYVVPNGQHMITKLVVRTSCLAETGCVPMFNLIRQVIFDSEVRQQAKVIEILKKMIDDMEDDVQTNAHVYTTRRIQSQYGLPGYIREQWKGITQLMNLRRILIEANDEWEALSMKLILMKDKITRGHRNGMALSLTGDKASIKGVAYGVELFVKDDLPIPTQKERFPDFATAKHPWYDKGKKSMDIEINSEGENEAFLVPSRVNAFAKGGVLFDAGEPLRGADLVVLQYIGGYFLYDELRFGQGAAEAWAVVDIDTGSVVYQSDQDPNIAETLDIYERAAAWVYREISGKSSLPPEAEGSIVGAIGALDGSAMKPENVGFASLVQWLTGNTEEVRLKFRQEILGANVNDFLAMVDRLGSWGKPSVAVVTNQAQYDTAFASGLALTKCDYTGTRC